MHTPTKFAPDEIAKAKRELNEKIEALKTAPAGSPLDRQLRAKMNPPGLVGLMRRDAALETIIGQWKHDLAVEIFGPRYIAAETGLW